MLIAPKHLGTHSTPPRHPRAFTLLELVLVLVVISVALSIAAPALRGFSRGAKMHDAATQFTAMCHWARTQAISTSRVYRLVVQPANAQYRVMVQDGDTFVSPSSAFGQVFVMPEGYRLTLTKADGSVGDYVDFYPNGRTDPARIQIISDDGETSIVECPTPAETFRILPPAEVPR
jgi:prepilin-type N-terminal cleavage/methylation domain-containing protein